MGPDQFLFDVAKANGNVVGMDISIEITSRAKRMSEQHSPGLGKYVCCDVRHLPLGDNSIDLIISDSTLDHFPNESDIVTALKELGRVLQAGGTLILTIDNKSNLTYPPYFIIHLWMKLGLSPYFIGKTLSFTKLRHSLEEIGFSVKKARPFFTIPTLMG